MKLEMTELGPVKRSLKIEVPEEAVKSEFQKVYAQLRRQAKNGMPILLSKMWCSGWCPIIINER